MLGKALGLAAAVCCFAGLAQAQPATFFNLGDRAVPATPWAQTSISEAGWFNFGGIGTPGETLTVKWARINFTTPIQGDAYFDASLYVTTPPDGADLLMALYDNTGNLVATDDVDGFTGFTGGAGLSFGSSGERIPTGHPTLAGQDGTLAAGTYWLAVVAGPANLVTFGATNWGVTTRGASQLGFGDGQLSFEVYMFVGNTTPPPPPANNDCANAITVTEDVNGVPAWTGTNYGATQDGTTCYNPLAGITQKDVWLRYVPSRTGFAELISTPAGNSRALLVRFDGDCGSSPVQCIGGETFLVPGPQRMSFPVTQGVPVLLSHGLRAGGVGDFSLSIKILPAPCELSVPAGAIDESEPCGSRFNAGCSLAGGFFDAISPGQTVRGTLLNGQTLTDQDWFEFNVTQATTGAVTFASQRPAEVRIIRPGVAGDCTGTTTVTSKVTPDGQSPCVPTTTSAVLSPGRYWVSIRHRTGEWFGCDSGYSDYWMTVSAPECDKPVITSPPTDVTACKGAAATFRALAMSARPTTYAWQWQPADGSQPWTNVANGRFTAAGSGATISNAGTPLMTVTGIDGAAAGVNFRAAVTSCDTAISPTVRVNYCPADTDNGTGQGRCDQAVDIGDLLYFLLLFSEGRLGADLDDGSGRGGSDNAVTIEDLLYYLQRFELGC